MEVVISGDAPIVGRPLKDAGLPKNSLIGTIIRGTEVIVPHGSSEVLAGDRVVVFTNTGSVPKVQRLLGL